MATSIVNLNHRPKPEYDIYCGREGNGQSGYFGNWHNTAHVGRCRYCFRKYGLTKKHEGLEALRIFETEACQRIIDDPEWRAGLMKCRDKRLACFCVKRDGSGPCHVRLYVRLLDGLSAVGWSERDLIAAARAELVLLEAAAEAADA